MQSLEFQELHTLLHAYPTQHIHSAISQTYTFKSSTKNLNMMQPSEVSAILTLPHASPPQQSSHFSTFYTNIPLPSSHIHPPAHILSTDTSSLRTNSNSTEAKEDEQSILNEMKLKRLISSRESARRARLRRKKKIEDLQLQVDHLIMVNRQLTEQLIHLLECNYQIFQENAQLKDEISSLQKVLADLQTPLRDLEEIARCMIHLRAEALNPTTVLVNSMNLLY